MLCTKCSSPVTPVVAIDIDGTIADYHGHFLKFADGWLGRSRDLPHYDGTDPFGEWFAMAYNCTIEEYRQIKLAYRQGGMKRTMPIRTGAQALCWAVRDAGAELWVTTTRPYLSLDNIVPDTVEWLRRHGIDYDGMLFDEDKYAQLADRIDSRRVVAVIDDLGEMYDAAERQFSSHPLSDHVPILVSGPYNSGVRRTMMSSLDACCDIVLARINWWKGDMWNVRES